MTSRLLFFTALTAMLVAGCVSTHMRQFIGEDIREVVMSDGAPVNVFDYSGGQRVFQFYWGGGSYTVPATSTTSGRAYAIGSTVYGSTTTISTPARTVSNEGCLTSYITRWDEDRSGWIVEDIRYPQRLVC